MALKLSTRLRNDLLGGRELREIFEDAVIKIYSGAAPTAADDAVTGTLLVTITKASGTVTSGEVSTAKEAKLVIGSHALNETFIVTINGTSYTYTNNPDVGDEIAVATEVAKMINNAEQPVWAATCGTATIYIRSKYRGLNFTIAKSGTGTHTLTDDAVANVTQDTIRFGAPSAGAISKDAAVWSGVAVATGTAGYFRIVNSADDGSLDSVNLDYPRLQGSVGVSGTEMTLSNTTITSGATQTIDTATITMPAS